MLAGSYVASPMPVALPRYTSQYKEQAEIKCWGDRPVRMTTLSRASLKRGSSAGMSKGILLQIDLGLTAKPIGNHGNTTLILV